MKAHIVAAVLSFVTLTTPIVVLVCGCLLCATACTESAAESVFGPPPPAPTGGGASGGAQCGKDSDCKGDRTCDHGQCVSPR